jgi:multidrug transporter EmrE-like cation transporter
MISFGLSQIHKKIPIRSHIYLLIFSILIQAFCAICTKYASESGSLSTFYGIRLEIIIYFVILGGMGLQVIFWQNALKYYSLSFAYPFRSLVSFVVLISAYVLFQESITYLNVIGLAIISIGIFYLGKDKEFLK